MIEKCYGRQGCLSLDELLKYQFPPSIARYLQVIVSMSVFPAMHTSLTWQLRVARAGSTLRCRCLATRTHWRVLRTRVQPHSLYFNIPKTGQEHATSRHCQAYDELTYDRRRHKTRFCTARQNLNRHLPGAGGRPAWPLSGALGPLDRPVRQPVKSPRKKRRICGAHVLACG